MHTPTPTGRLEKMLLIIAEPQDYSIRITDNTKKCTLCASLSSLCNSPTTGHDMVGAWKPAAEGKQYR